MTGVLMTLLLTGACCALCGVFLVLRNQSMMADAISHTVLLGIVLAFLLVRDVASSWLMIGATLAGLLTVYWWSGCPCTMCSAAMTPSGLCSRCFFPQRCCC